MIPFGLDVRVVGMDILSTQMAFLKAFCDVLIKVIEAEVFAAWVIMFWNLVIRESMSCGEMSRR